MTKQAWGMLFGVLVAQPVLAPMAAAESQTVTLSGINFAPKEVAIVAGDTVTWRHNSGSNTHTVTFEDGFDPYSGCSGTLDLPDSCMTEGDTVERQFLLAGTFRYFCRIHRRDGMVGVVTVRGSSLAATTSTTKPAPTATSGISASSSSSSSSTSTTVRPAATTSTARATPASIVIRTTTTTAGPVYAPVARGAAPAFNPADEAEPADQGNGTAEETAPAAGEQAAAADDRDTGGGSAGLIAGAGAAVALGGGFALWRVRPGKHR